MPLVVPLVTTAWRTYLSSSLSVASVFTVADAVAQQLERKYCQPTPEYERTMRARFAGKQRAAAQTGQSTNAGPLPTFEAAPAAPAAHTPLARAKYDFARTAKFAALGGIAGACLVPVVATTRSFIPGLDSALAMLPVFGPLGVPGLFFAVLSLPPLGMLSYNINRREEYEFHVPPNIADLFNKYTLMSFGFWWTCGYLNCVCQIITDSLGAQTGVLPDLGFWLLPWLPLPWLPSVVVGTSAAFLVTAGATSSRWPLGVLVRRFMAIHGFILFFRGISIISTVLPNPDITCVAYHPHAFPLAALLVSMGVNNTCGDVLFSGHGAALMLSAMAFRKYTVVPEGYKTAFDVFNGVSMLAIVATHYHYTIDVVVGAFLTWVAFHSYHRMLPHRGESSMANFLHWLQHSNNVDPALLEEELAHAKGVHFDSAGARTAGTTFDTFASLMCGSPAESMSPTSPAITSKDPRVFMAAEEQHSDVE